MFRIFSFYAMWYGFGNCKYPFVNNSCHLQWAKLPDFNAFPVNLHWREDSEFFPTCWILISQFKFPARQPYARMDAMLHGFAVVMRTRPREIPLATITWENQFMGFLYFPIWVWGSVGSPSATGAPLFISIILKHAANANANLYLHMTVNNSKAHWLL